MFIKIQLTFTYFVYFLIVHVILFIPFITQSSYHLASWMAHGLMKTIGKFSFLKKKQFILFEMTQTNFHLFLLFFIDLFIIFFVLKCLIFCMLEAILLKDYSVVVHHWSKGNDLEEHISNFRLLIWFRLWSVFIELEKSTFQKNFNCYSYSNFSALKFI